MSLKYALQENLLTADLDDYTAQLQNVTSHDLKSVIKRMLKGGSTITKSDTLAVLNSFFETVRNITKDGETVHLDLFKTNLSVSGVFKKATDSFDPKRHTVNVNINAGKLLRQAIAGVKMEKTTATELRPHILEVKDSISESVNENITSGGVIEIVGSLFKIAGDHPKNGIYFVATDGTIHKAATLIHNKPGRLLVMVPVLKVGVYSLQITTQYSGGYLLKKPKTAVFARSLTVI